ncbi:hypothetical protein EYR36_001963 [Pleurotus pulmonarius]|nr:hypothetical protein EYR36_001963 [Pleurotus pulmonarius]KAF4588285.1 hypothetical protein EYR38_010252 [Pleurotus pulmonarius]
MGQRHQAFLIAKVPHSHKGNIRHEYQCVAAIHHQWCYGTLPARAARRFLDLAKVPTTAELIRFELRHLEENEGIRGRHSPSPYLLYILSLAFSADLERGYTSSTLFENATMDSFGGDNNDGITIFDVTDPSNCTYCHVISASEGPISSEQYVRSYYPEDDDGPDDIPPLLESMQQAPLISFETLADAWPCEYNRYCERKDGSVSSDVSRETSATDLNGGVPRLTDMIIQPALLRCIAGDDLSAIEPFLWMPDKKPAIIRALQELDPFPDLALPLLDRILEFGPDDIVDLSQFALTSSQVVQFVSQHDATTKFTLAGMKLVTIDTVKQLLNVAPRTSYLNVLDTPILPSEIAQLLAAEPQLFYHMETMLHPAFLTSRWLEPANDLFFSLPHIAEHHSAGCSALPYATPSKIIQAVTDFMTFNGLDEAKYYYGTMATVCLSSELRTPGQSWGARAVSVFPIVNNPTRLKGLGWSFVSTPDFYAFCRRPGTAESLQVTDVRGCIDSLVAEGRPPPQEADIKTLEELLATMKYKTGSIDDITEFEAKLEKRLSRTRVILRDPTIAARVRSLALETENILVERKRQPWLRAKATRVLQLSRKSIRRRRSVSIRSDVRAFKATLRETKDVLKAMRQAFDKMTRLECCIIDAGNQLHPNSMEPPARPLLVTMSLVVGRNLRYLVLQGTVHHLSAWVTSAHMERLEELMMTVLAYPAHFGSSSEHSEDMKFIVSRLAPFINSVSPSLVKLQLSFSCEIDLSGFLRALTDIPHLCHLLLQASLYPTFQSDPNILCEFLAEKVPPSCRVHLAGIFQSNHPRRCVLPRGPEDTAFSAHKGLPVNSLYRSQEADIDIVTTLAERLGHRLDNIHLYQYSLSIPQFEVMATMKTNITLLHHIQGQTLAAAFFDFLSLHVAHFVALGIVYEEIYGNRDAPYNCSVG